MATSRTTKAALARAYQETFEPVAGKMVLRDLIGLAGFMNVDAEPMNGEDALFRAGRRSVIASMLQRLQWSEAELLALGEAMTASDILNAEELTMLRELDEQDGGEDNL